MKQRYCSEPQLRMLNRLKAGKVGRLYTSPSEKNTLGALTRSRHAEERKDGWHITQEGLEVARKETLRAERERLRSDQAGLMNDCANRCMDIFISTSERELSEMPAAIQHAWATGKELQITLSKILDIDTKLDV